MLGRDSDRALYEAAGGVVDPVLFHTLGELGTLQGVKIKRRIAHVTVAVPGPEYPAAGELRKRLLQVANEADVDEVDLVLENLSDDERVRIGELLTSFDGGDNPLVVTDEHESTADRPNPFVDKQSTTRVLCISSGKGGVGKSSLTVNLAVALAQAGHSVGLLDADIYGFSIPRMLGVGYLPVVLGKTILPPVANGVRCISIGFFVEEDQAIAWRGPMLHRAIEQFLVDVHWGAPEFLLIDMPPGTGDIALSVAQQLPKAEIYIVTTPQSSAERVAQRMGSLGKQMKIPVRGVIENMSWFTTPDGQRFEPFGHGGGELLAETLGVPLLAKVPLVTRLREGADDGLPIVASEPEGEVGLIFAKLADEIAGAGPTRIYRKELTIS